MILRRKEKNEKKKASSTWEWQLSLQANPKSFNFYFKATNILFLPFNFALRVSKSDPHVVVNQSKSVKAKLLCIIRKFRIRGTNREAASSAANGITVDVTFPPARFRANQEKFDAYKKPKCMDSIIIGFIGLLSRSLSQKDQNIIILCSWIILLFLAVTSIAAIGHLSSTLKNWENSILDYYGHY